MSVDPDILGVSLASVTYLQCQLLLGEFQGGVRGAGMLTLSWLSKRIFYPLNTSKLPRSKVLIYRAELLFGFLRMHEQY